MSVLFCISMFTLGLVFLVGGSSLFVDSAVFLAKKFHVSEVLIGATIVSLGTTLPEILFSTGASFREHTDMALGNALGSILCNTGFIAGVMICMVCIRLNDANMKSLKRHLCFLFVSLFVYIISGIFFSGLTRFVGLLLVAVGLWFLWSLAKQVSPAGDYSEATEEGLTVSDILRLLLEVILIFMGANFLLEYGPVLARMMGVPEVVISLTFVAAGTSLPELVTSLVSLKKKHASLSLGNILGADILNLVFVGGLSAVIHPIPYQESVLALEIPFIVFLLLVLCVPSIRTKRTKKWQGYLLICIYGLYLWLMLS